MDRKTEKMLFDALSRAKEHSKQQQEKNEEKLWISSELPCSLFDGIRSLTKNEIDTIRKNFELKSLSSLKKLELAEAISHQIPAYFKSMLFLLDDEQYNLVKKISTSESNFIVNPDLPYEKLTNLRDRCIFFPINYNGENVLYMPSELVNIFQETDGLKLKNAIRMNSEWIQLTHGMVHYYGVVDSSFLLTQIKKSSNYDIDSSIFYKIMDLAKGYYRKIRFVDDGFADRRVFDTKKIVEEQNLRASIDYKLFTKDQIIAAAAPNYFEKSKAMMSLLKFLNENYKISKSELEDVACQLEYLVNADSPTAAIMEYLQSTFEFPNAEFVGKLNAHLMEVYNNTRQWVLKGYTPSEVSKLNNKTNHSIKRADSNKVVQLSDYKKTGRNEPCPCGSGKKYKKCCLK